MSSALYAAQMLYASRDERILTFEDVHCTNAIIRIWWHENKKDILNRENDSRKKFESDMENESVSHNGTERQYYRALFINRWSEKKWYACNIRTASQWRPSYDSFVMIEYFVVLKMDALLIIIVISMKYFCTYIIEDHYKFPKCKRADIKQTNVKLQLLRGPEYMQLNHLALTLFKARCIFVYETIVFYPTTAGVVIDYGGLL